MIMPRDDFDSELVKVRTRVFIATELVVKALVELQLCAVGDLCPWCSVEGRNKMFARAVGMLRDLAEDVERLRLLLAE